MTTGTNEFPDTETLALALRRHVVEMCGRGGSAHVGSGLSMADIVAVLYGAVLRQDASDPLWQDRDRLIVSKGHACACIYAALAEQGFFPVETLVRHYQNGSHLAGHLTHKGVAGVEFSTGSLGHGLGVGAGIAMQLRRRGGRQRVFVVLSDGECDEGSTWEAILFAAHHRLANLRVVVDFNKLQGLAAVRDTLGLEPFKDKWQAFGWSVVQVDGHDHAALEQAFSAPADDRPTCIIADTVKGKGVSFMENQILWHYRVPAGEEFKAAMLELGVAGA